MARIAVRVLVKGYVQGVGFRVAMREVSRRRNVSGWVRNRRDGAVEAHLEGEEDDVNFVVSWARKGPPRARVTAVEVQRAELLGYKDFKITF